MLPRIGEIWHVHKRPVNVFAAKYIDDFTLVPGDKFIISKLNDQQSHIEVCFYGRKGFMRLSSLKSFCRLVDCGL